MDACSWFPWRRCQVALVCPAQLQARPEWSTHNGPATAFGDENRRGQVGGTHVGDRGSERILTTRHPVDRRVVPARFPVPGGIGSARSNSDGEEQPPKRSSSTGGCFRRTVGITGCGAGMLGYCRNQGRPAPRVHAACSCAVTLSRSSYLSQKGTCIILIRNSYGENGGRRGENRWLPVDDGHNVHGLGPKSHNVVVGGGSVGDGSVNMCQHRRSYHCPRRLFRRTSRVRG